MRFDNLDIHSLTQHLCSGFQQSEAQIYPGGKITGHTQWHLFRTGQNTAFLLRSKTGGPDHNGAAVGSAVGGIIHSSQRLAIWPQDSLLLLSASGDLVQNFINRDPRRGRPAIEAISDLSLLIYALSLLISVWA